MLTVSHSLRFTASVIFSLSRKFAVFENFSCSVSRNSLTWNFIFVQDLFIWLLIIPTVSLCSFSHLSCLSTSIMKYHYYFDSSLDFIYGVSSVTLTLNAHEKLGYFFISVRCFKSIRASKRSMQSDVFVFADWFTNQICPMRVYALVVTNSFPAFGTVMHD